MRDPGLNSRTSLATLDAEALAIAAPFDVLAEPDVEDLYPAGAALWPRGAAWSTPDGTALDGTTRLAGLTRVLLAPFTALYRRAFLLAREASPALLDTTLPEWERDHGLPGPCVVGEQTRAERLAALAAKVKSDPLVTPGDFIRYAASVGFEIEIEEPAVFECGFSECGGEHATGSYRQEYYWIARVDATDLTLLRRGALATLPLEALLHEDGALHVLDEAVRPSVEAAITDIEGLRFAGAKATLAATVNVKRDALLAGGYQHNFGGTAGIRTLDTRDERDAINWLGLKMMVDRLIADDQGAVSIEMRDAGNATFSASASTVGTALSGMAEWQGAVLARSWTLKDAIAVAADVVAFDAIDLVSGWPA